MREAIKQTLIDHGVTDISGALLDDLAAKQAEPSKEARGAADMADSGMDAETVATAEWAWANLPVGSRKWTSLPTHEKALVCHIIARIRAKCEAKQADAVEALEQIEQWADSYPPDIFQEPDLDAVKALLADHDMLVQMDRMHASWARRLTEGIGNIARAALKGERP